MLSKIKNANKKWRHEAQRKVIRAKLRRANDRIEQRTKQERKAGYAGSIRGE